MMTMRDPLEWEEHRRDLLREAEAAHLAAGLPARQGAAHRLACRGLAWLGARLSAWGSRLQARYAPQAMAQEAGR